LLPKRALAPDDLAPDDLARAGVGVPPWRSWDLVAIPPLLPPTIGRIDGRFNTRPLRSASDLLREFRTTDNVSGRGRFPEVR
jgi:hypothetical protein